MRVATKSKSPWNELRPLGIFIAGISPNLIPPSWKLRSSKSSSICVTNRTELTAVGAVAAFSNLIVYGKSAPIGIILSLP